jgi:ABC-2 type transport system ATP-binding protein
MDEPGEGMDLPARDLLCQVLNERRLRGLTSLLVSHGLPEIQALCDQAAVLRAGRVVFSGSLSELNCNAAGAPQPIEESLRELYEAAVP